MGKLLDLWRKFFYRTRRYKTVDIKAEDSDMNPAEKELFAKFHENGIYFLRMVLFRKGGIVTQSFMLYTAIGEYVYPLTTQKFKTNTEALQYLVSKYKNDDLTAAIVTFKMASSKS